MYLNRFVAAPSSTDPLIGVGLGLWSLVFTELDYVLLENDPVPPHAVTALDLCYATLENELAVDSVLLVDLYVNKELTAPIYPVGSQERITSTEAT